MLVSWYLYLIEVSLRHIHCPTCANFSSKVGRRRGTMICSRTGRSVGSYNYCMYYHPYKELYTARRNEGYVQGRYDSFWHWRLDRYVPVNMVGLWDHWRVSLHLMSPVELAYREGYDAGYEHERCNIMEDERSFSRTALIHKEVRYFGGQRVMHRWAE